MELSVSGRVKRAAQNTKTTAQTKTKSAAAGKNAALRPRSDKQEWSRQALAFLQELNRQDMEKQRKLLEAKQRGSSELEMAEKSLKVMDRCRKIASRIMRGDKVPPQDEQYLMECDPEGYKMAIVCRVPKEKPKEWESVLNDEDQEGGSSSGEGAPGGEAAEAVDSGGGTSEV